MSEKDYSGMTDGFGEGIALALDNGFGAGEVVGGF